MEAFSAELADMQRGLEVSLAQERKRNDRNDVEIAKLEERINTSMEEGKSLELMHNEVCRRAEETEAENRKLKEEAAVLKMLEAVEKRVNAHFKGINTKMDRLERKIDLLMEMVRLLLIGHGQPPPAVEDTDEPSKPESDGY